MVLRSTLGICVEWPKLPDASKDADKIREGNNRKIVSSLKHDQVLLQYGTVREQ